MTAWIFENASPFCADESNRTAVSGQRQRSLGIVTFGFPEDNHRVLAFRYDDPLNRRGEERIQH